MQDFLHLVVEPPESNLLYTGHYDPVLVTLSIAAAIFASYAALLVSVHVTETTEVRTRRIWIAAGGTCMGLGIWAMHFVGMLAFSLPCGTAYDPLITLLSMVPGILASILVMTVISRPTLSPAQLASGGLLLGLGIGTMHYSGMAALQLDGLIRYDLKLFLLSILVAVALATLAIWLRFRLQSWRLNRQFVVPVVSAIVMGLAVSGMHYTAMAAAYFISDGDKSIVDSQITPTFLASMVLIVTGALIVMTIVASYVAKPKLFSLRGSYEVTGLMIAGWVAIAWLSAGYYYDHLASTIYQQESQLAKRRLDQVTNSIDDTVQMLKGIALVTALDHDTHEALRRFGTDAVPDTQSYADRKRVWTEDGTLGALNRSLAVSATHLNADVLWIVDAAGDCVASSNAGTATSFVGTNYADRDYFRQARAGQNGHQYAVGRASKIPGLYYSAPILQNGRFIGAAVVKRDITKFGRWTNPVGAFISDSNGVVVLAADPQLENRTLPNAPFANLSPEKRQMQYKQSRFEPLQVTRWSDGQFPSAVLLGDSKVPVVLLSRILPEDAITIHMPRPLIELTRLNIERSGLFILLAVAGSMLIIAAGAIVLYVRQARETETNLRIAAAAFDVQEGMMITDAKGIIQRVNQAFTEITGYMADEVVGQTPGLLSSGRHDAAFYDAMWEEINTSGGWQGEVINRRKNGEEFPEWLTITAVRGVHGEITHYVGTMNDISQRKEAEEEIRHLAFYDALTQLPNRRLLTDRLKQAMTASTRTGHCGALLFIDLDNFKTLNDSLGHDKGDLLLQQVAERLVQCVREGDTVSRFGGDEFVVMLEDLSDNLAEAATQTRVVGEKILAMLDQLYVLDGYKYHSTSSIGATLFQDHTDSMDELLKQADLAMYQAKDAGRNVLRFFDQGMQAVANARAALEADMHQALRENEFVLYYQPQVDSDGKLTGAETLVRWQHPRHGLVPPAEFIPLAEETGLILPLGHWVLETACAQLVAWSSRPELADITLAVNISARQFRHPDFAYQVLTIIKKSGANPQKLKLELTESLLLDDVVDIISKMSALKAEGVGFSLDDFGTGYSSLTYLKRLPLDQLKIDKSFVQDVLTDPNDAAIARTIVALARSMGLSVIAEGVETEAQRDFLASEGCDAYQGYLFGRPMPIQKFELMVS
jgi:diguanylate cyclase (GGDEF)-like protein/PAS domain S-box-containing protein